MRHHPFTHPYHPFPTNRSLAHILPIFGVLLIPLIALFAFSYVAKIDIGTLAENLGVSLSRILIAFIISVVFGWIFAAVFYKGKRSKWALPIFDVLESFPTYSALPIAVVYWGPSNWVIILFLVLAIIWPIFFTITSSLKLIRRDWVEAVKLSQISGWQYLKLFLIPVTLPGLITGSIIGLGNGWEALVATEIISATKSGLGPFFNLFSHNLNVTFFGILTILTIVFAINKLVWLPLLEKTHALVEE